MNHTPTPWSWNTHHQLSGETECLKDESGKNVLTWGRRSNHEGVEYTYLYISKEDAAFIVRACNAHDPLLKAANQALEALDIHPAKTNGFAPRQSKIRAAAKRKLRDAIAQAKSGEEGA